MQNQNLAGSNPETQKSDYYVALIDSGIANIGSVEKAMSRVGIPVIVTNVPATIKGAQGVVFPGVGAFSRAAEILHEKGLVVVIKEVVAKRVPFLGICLGLQLLFEYSEEKYEHETLFPKGLSLVGGGVKKFPPGVQIPHVGWNRAVPVKEHPLWEGLPNAAYFYFTHSFFVSPDQDFTILAQTDYSGLQFSSAVAESNLMGVQFHPEKSGPVGLRLLHNFGKIVQDPTVLFNS